MSSLSLPQIRLPSSVRRSKLFWKRKRSAIISDVDPQFRVTYLGNVLTGWAKGSGCVDKPLATLWRNHTGTDKPNIVMKVTISASGLKAVTKEHGLTEYWANRITFCTADPNYPKVFCWIYRHEGRKMKQELRCHAVLCPSENKAKMMATRLTERLHQALIDFRKEKMSRQNARLSLANAIYDNPSMPYRKILLHTGSSNYRPSPDRSKSAPKLKMIEEAIVEEDEDDLEEDPHERAAAAGVSPSVLCRSKSTPLALDDDRSIMTFQLGEGAAVSTAQTSLASGIEGVGILIDVLEDPTPSFEPLNLEDRLKQVPNSATNHAILARFDDVEDSSEDEEEEEDRDEIKDYLIRPSDVTDSIAAPTAKLRLTSNGDSNEVDSGASVSPDSNHFSTRSSSSSSADRKGSPSFFTKTAVRKQPSELPCVDVDSLGEEDEEEIHKIPEQLVEADAISDESGYSEENQAKNAAAAARRNSNSSSVGGSRKEMHSGATTIVMLNTSMGDNDCDNGCSPVPAPRGTLTKGEEQVAAVLSTSPIQCDLTVHSALISDFSATERLRYLGKSSSEGGAKNSDSGPPSVPDFMQNRIAEFCINI